MAENNGMAGGVVAALSAQGDRGSVSEQDGDHAAINRIALGTQTVSTGRTPAICARRPAKRPSNFDGKKMTAIPDVKPFTGGAKGVKVNGILLTPLPITAVQRDRQDRRQGRVRT